MHLALASIAGACVPLQSPAAVYHNGIRRRTMACPGGQGFLAFLPAHNTREGGCRRQRLHFTPLSTSVPGQRQHPSAGHGLLLARASSYSAVLRDTVGDSAAAMTCACP